MKYVNSIYTPDQIGRLGGIVFGKNKYGYFIKMFKSPVNPRSQSQQNIRAFFAAAAREWAKLTNVQRDGWNDEASKFEFVKNGISYTLTGFNLFVKLNRNLQDIGSTFYKDVTGSTLIVPADMNGSSVDIITTPGSEDIKLNIPSALSVNTKAIVYATDVLKSSRKVNWKQLRVIGVIDNTFVSGGSIMTMYTDKFGTMPLTGESAGFAVMPVDKVCGLTNAKVYVVSVGTI